MRRTANVLRAAAASAALALLLIGVPALLITAVGWPLPRHLPTITTLVDTLTGHQPLETTTVWKVLAVILWLAWLQIVVAAVVEAVASARGSLPNTVPGFSLAHGLVAPLVAAIVLTWPAGTSTPAAASPLPITEPPGTTVDVPTASPPSTAAPQPDTPAAATVEHVVQRRDTLWDLAERYLGDGYRSREIFDLNRDRTQPDGGTLTDPGVIRPGWRLQIPAGTSVAEPDGQVTVQPGDTLWDIAERALGDGHRFGEIVELNKGATQPDGHTLTDPELIEPGWVLQLPAAENPAPVLTGPPASPEPYAPTGPTELPPNVDAALAPPTSVAPDPASTRSTETDHVAEDQRQLAAFGLIGGGLATAGVLALLQRRRRAQLRRREPHQVPPPLPPELLAADSALHAGADTTAAATLDAALRSAAAASGPHGLAALEQVEVRDQSVTFTAQNPVAPPKGFDPEGPNRWTTDAHADGDPQAPTETASPTPALVPIGVDTDGRTVLVDLETPVITTITGDPQAARRLLNSIATAAATSTWSDHTRVLHVGTPPVALDDLDAVPTFEEALDALEARARRAADALDAADFTTVAQARAAGITPDLWTPLVVVAPEVPNPTDLDRLQRLAAQQPNCVAVVLCGDASLPARIIEIDADGAASIDGRPGVAAHLLDADELARVGELLDLTDEPCVPAPQMSIDDRRRRTPIAAHDGALDALLGQVDVLIRVLGEVEALRVTGDGAEERLKAPTQKSLEALTYLALREDRVDREDLQAALWPAGDNSTKTFHNTIWAARKLLTDTGGAELFPDPTEGHYALGAGVATDYELFHDLTARAEGAEDPDAAANLLAEALTLVRGEPFTGVGRNYSWAAPHAGLIVAQVVDAAEELGEIRLAAGDWRGAEWAARQGLLVFPCDERLYRLLMRAAHASGNIPAVHRAFDELAAVVADPDDGVEPDDTLHPETVTLLEDLTGSRPRADRATA